MSSYTYFDWFTELRLFVYVRNRKIDVVLKASRAVVMLTVYVSILISHAAQEALCGI
jgi:hypothetical protein